MRRIDNIDSEADKTCLDYIIECGINGRETEIIKQYYKERGVSDELINNSENAISVLAEMCSRMEDRMKLLIGESVYKTNRKGLR